MKNNTCYLLLSVISLIFIVSCSANEENLSEINQTSIIEPQGTVKSWLCLTCGKFKYQENKPSRYGCTSRWASQGWHSWVNVVGPTN